MLRSVALWVLSNLAWTAIVYGVTHIYRRVPPLQTLPAVRTITAIALTLLGSVISTSSIGAALYWIANGSDDETRTIRVELTLQAILMIWLAVFFISGYRPFDYSTGRLGPRSWQKQVTRPITWSFGLILAVIGVLIVVSWIRRSLGYPN
jgi:hypothetical protein